MTYEWGWDYGYLTYIWSAGCPPIRVMGALVEAIVLPPFKIREQSSNKRNVK